MFDFFATPRITLISDELTRDGLQAQLSLNMATPWHIYRPRWLRHAPLLMVESAWKGWRNAWKFKIASYPDHSRRNNQALRRLVGHAKSKGIVTVFWNKEDGVHFDRFIDSAKLFDHVFTVDESCIPRYKAVMGEHASIHTLMFAVQPKLHCFTGFDFKHRRANFVGSYSQHIHPKRREWQNMLFQEACNSGLGVSVRDRNSDRKAEHYRYPDIAGLEVLPAIPHAQTAQMYKDYLVSLNINTVENSATMFSRRLVEVIACGGIAVTNPSRAVDAIFKDYCHVVREASEARELFDRLHRDGPSAIDLEQARAGAEYVARHHTWKHRLEQISSVTGIDLL